VINNQWCYYFQTYGSENSFSQPSFPDKTKRKAMIKQPTPEMNNEYHHVSSFRVPYLFEVASL
jgi:hypothetical protein